MFMQAERQRAELQRELAALGDHVDEANEAARSQVASQLLLLTCTHPLTQPQRHDQLLYVRNRVSQTETRM